jgi:hypothetical protein
MQHDTALQSKIQRIGTLVEQLEASADPHARALAKELLESLMALHGAGLERILELATASGEPGKALIDNCGRDELVGSLLLLYGLHPESLHTRITRALEKSRSLLEPHAARAELLSIDDNGAISIRLHLKPNGGCGAASLKSTLEAALQDAAPDAPSIHIEEIGSAAAGFVPLANLQSGQPIALSAAATATPEQRSAD